MANQEHVDRLLQGVEAWNQWREENPEIKPDLSGADLSGANLRSANLSNANLSNANLSGANLKRTNISRANLSRTNLGGAIFSGAYLEFTDLRDAHLKGTGLGGAHLSGADLSNANLEDACLNGVQALNTILQAANLTGATVADWSINAHTNLQDIVCEYIFTGYNREDKQFTDRRPHDPNQFFAPGEFTKRYQIVLETVDLFFNDGIDWKAFLDSLHDLQSQYGDELSIRDIGRRAGSSFVVQLEVPPESDKGTIERQAKELYATKLQQLEAHYQERLQLRGEQLLFFQEQVGIERIRNTRLERIIETMAEKDSPRYDLRGARFGGGFAADGGTQTGGTFNDFSHNIEQNINEIDSLIQSLRSQAEAFPEGIRQETLEHIGDLESDIQQPPEQRKPSRIKATLLALAGMATLVSGAVAGANEFAGNLQELSEKLGLPIPIEQLQPQSQPDAIDVKAIGSDRS